MTTKISTTRKRSQTRVAAQTDVSGKKIPVLQIQIQNLSIGEGYSYLNIT